MTNGNLKYEPQEIKAMKIESGKIQNIIPAAPSDILQDFKQEPDNEFADLVTVQDCNKPQALIFLIFRILEALLILWRMTKTS